MSAVREASQAAYAVVIDGATIARIESTTCKGKNFCRRTKPMGV